MKVSEMQGPALDWAVEVAEEMTVSQREFQPSANWDQGGPIIERERIEITWHIDHWTAMWWADNTRIKDQQFAHNRRKQGPTPLIAAMRAYVASRMGEEIDIPEGLQ